MNVLSITTMTPSLSLLRRALELYRYFQWNDQKSGAAWSSKNTGMLSNSDSQPETTIWGPYASNSKVGQQYQILIVGSTFIIIIDFWIEWHIAQFLPIMNYKDPRFARNLDRNVVNWIGRRGTWGWMGARKLLLVKITVCILPAFLRIDPNRGVRLYYLLYLLFFNFS